MTAVAPGVIKTPLWTDNPDKLRLIAADDAWVTPEFVADVMVSLVERETVRVSAKPAGLRGAATEAGSQRGGGNTREVAVEGGMILEVAKRRVRVVEQFHDEGPSGEGNTVGNKGIAETEIFDMLGSGRWGR